MPQRRYTKAAVDQVELFGGPFDGEARVLDPDIREYLLWIPWSQRTAIYRRDNAKLDTAYFAGYREPLR